MEFNPFIENQVAVASGSNFGIVGVGQLWILRFDEVTGKVYIKEIYKTPDVLFDLAWHEKYDNLLITGSGDGSICLFDTSQKLKHVKIWKEHSREIFSVNWNYITKEHFISSSWDHTIKLWKPDMNNSLKTFHGHKGCIYSTAWSPSDPNVFVSASGDGTIKLWDINQNNHILNIQAHPTEILSVDWNKYNKNLIVTGSIDKSLKIFDIRNPSNPLVQLFGHNLAIRKVKYSPHHANIIGSVSYDMTLRIWDVNQMKCIDIFDNNTEFVTGIDWNLFKPGQLVTCGWDENVHFINI